jgi:UDP-N-acetylglucosamine pyrophosphorylase
LHKRTPSQTDIAEFKDLTKKDALTRIQKSLNKLVLTAQPQSQKVCIEIFHLINKLFSKKNFSQNIRAELDGFEQLFGRYLSDNVDQTSIDWQEIQPPPEETVRQISKYHFLFSRIIFLLGYSVQKIT